ncbi:hypothetical protein AB0420_05190 [Streptomyces caelestis]|uniref:hypothetical protein n=1 Tax=Streptomyces caelestis TaxID=36816 RepID=UPI0034504AA3
MPKAEIDAQKEAFEAYGVDLPSFATRADDEAHLRAVYGYEDLPLDHLKPDYEGDQAVRGTRSRTRDSPTRVIPRRASPRTRVPGVRSGDHRV